MKFKIVCTTHMAEVIMADEEINPLVKTAHLEGGDFEIAEDNLYCNYADDRGTYEHEFRIVQVAE